MCLDFPGLVLSREGDTALVESDGRRWRASTLLFPDLSAGDWVYVTAGTVVDRLDPAEAEHIRTTLLRAKGDDQ